jgi:sugar fermentation stimulation protein A
MDPDPALPDEGSDAVAIPLDPGGSLVESRFVERPNRFLLRCRIPRETRAALAKRGAAPGDEVQSVHMADPGRLRELLIPGKRVWIRYAASPNRETRWSAVLVESPDGRGLVSLNTALPNALVRRALERNALEELRPWVLEQAEWSYGRSRLDFYLTTPHRLPLVMEVKSVTLVEDDGVARFPDAVTSRGARHVRELAELKQSGDYEAAILFVLQRDDAHAIEAARSIDPVFADALAAAREAGVRVFGRRCRVTLEEMVLGEPVDVY